MDLLQGQGSSAELFEAQSHLYKHIFNFISSMSLKCAVQLGIPDIIHNHGQPITLPELISALELHQTRKGFLHRLMSLLVQSGIFRKAQVSKTQEVEEEEEAYDLTPSSRLLIKEKVPCLSPFVLSMLDPALVTPWHLLGVWFQKDDDVQTPFESAHGMNLWDYGDKNSEFGNLFDEAMIADSGMMNLVVKQCKPIFEGLGSLIDVGGGKGQVSKILTEAFPHLKCTVLDLPHVVANLQDCENLKFIGGDMFQFIPSADAVLLKLVLHGWSDEKCLKVLKSCRGAIPSNGVGKVIIIDVVINSNKDGHELTQVKHYFDLLMMVAAGGRERSEKDWEKLFLEAGFSHYKITPIF
ncbi:hypothetical protein UlMin_018364, partial [Ulmus minor]